MKENRTGSTIGQFILLRKESESALGAWYWGRRIDLSREVTCLLVNTDITADDEKKGKYIELVQKAAGVFHPGVTRVLDFDELDEIPPVSYIISEWIPGSNLRVLLEEMKQQGSWVTLGEAVRLVRQLALTYDYLYSADALRAFNPEKIKFRAEAIGDLPYTPVVVDLGLDPLVRKVADPGQNTLPAYLSPEGALSQPTDQRSVIYSLGILLFELATGQLPFPVTTLAEASRFHPRQPVPPPRTLRTDLPQSLEAVIIRSLQKNPASRYVTLAEFAEELNWLLPGLEGLIDPPAVFEKVGSLAALYLASLGEHREYAEKTAPALSKQQAGTGEPATRPVGKVQSAAGKVEKVEVTLDQVQISVEPGRTTSTLVAIHNPGSKDGNFILSIEGIPSGWVAFSPREFPLKAGEQKTAQLIVKPPRLSGTRAGRYTIAVKVVEKLNPQWKGEASITLTIGVFNQFRLEFSVPRTQGEESAELLITNTGNVPDTYTIMPQDLDGELSFDPEESQVRLNPDQVGKAEFTPTLRSVRLFGGNRSHAYTAVVRAASGEKQVQTGEYVSSSLMPAWVPLVLFLICLCSAAAGLIYVTQSTLRGTSSQRTQVAQQTGTSIAAQDTILAATQTVMALENANQATLFAFTQTALAAEAETATAQVGATITSISDTATAIAQNATAQANETAAMFVTETAAANETLQAGGAQTATAVSITATALSEQLLTATAQVGFSQTATAQAALFLTATAQSSFSQTATAQSAIGTAQAGTAIAQAATATAQANLTRTPAIKRVAYFYLTSTSLGNEYRNFLSQHNYDVILRPLDAIPSENLAQYKLILIAPETGQNGNWGDAAGTWAKKIADSDLPVVGLGEGGFNFFGKNSLSIGFPNGIGTTSQDLYVLNPNDQIWKTPNPIPIPVNRTLRIYNQSQDTMVSNLQPPFPVSITVYAQWPENVNQFPLIRQDGRFILWGYRQSPDEFTSSGASLFLNLLDDLTK
jgi:eukaryotic-like serine/threonine-protein kinase